MTFFYPCGAIPELKDESKPETITNFDETKSGEEDESIMEGTSTRGSGHYGLTPLSNPDVCLNDPVPEAEWATTKTEAKGTFHQINEKPQSRWSSS